MPQRRYLLSTAVACLLVIVALLPTVDDLHAGALVAGLALQAVVLGLLAWRPLPARRAALAGAMAYVISVALLRQGMGAFSGCGPLMLLPVMWMALHRRRTEMYVLLAQIAVVFVAPMILVGAPDYPPTGWRPGALLLVIAATLGHAVGVLVEYLHRQAQQSEVVLNAISEGFLVTHEGEILLVNPALCEMVGRTEAELLGTRPPFPFWIPERFAEYDARRRDLLAAGGGSTEVTLLHADGRHVPALVTAKVATLADGRPGVLASFRDLTERSAHEAATARHAEQLEAIADVTRQVGHSDPLDARRTVCRTALDVAPEGHVAMMWEPDGAGGMFTSAMHPDFGRTFRVSPTARHHAATVVMETGEPLFVSDTHASPYCDISVVSVVEARSALFVPIMDGRSIRGVLSVGWNAVRAEPPAEVLLLMGVLAEEAGIAMQRADLLTRLDELTRTDDLTGLPNRRAWDELLHHQLADGRRRGEPLSVAMLDLDFFKRYNDAHGHLAGDRLLQAAAATWTEHLRATDVVARWGGEEFAVLLPGCDAEQAAGLIERLRGTLPDGVTFSAGVAGSGATTDPRLLMDAADNALYAAKAGGRDRVVLASAPSAAAG